MEETKKESWWSRTKKWGSEHFEQILMGSLFVGGAVAGGLVMKDIAGTKMYAKGLNEFRGTHKDICNTIIEECGQEAAFQALNLVRSDPEMLGKLMSDPDSVIKKVEEIYHNTDYIKKLKAAVNE